MTPPPEREVNNMSAFEIKRDTEDVYGIRLWDGQCLWFNSREERDIAFLLIQ